MLAEERKEKILQLLEEKQVLKVSDLSAFLDAAEVTIRRDLDDLQDQHRLRRVHGGATTLPKTSLRVPQSTLKTMCIPEKQSIAKQAYVFLNDNDAIILDVSTTVLELARLIAKGSRTNLSIITNSFTVIQTLRHREDLHVMHTGGKVVDKTNGSLGSIAEQMLHNVKVEKCFLGANGVDPAYGYSTPTFEEASIKKSMIAASKKKFVLCDNTKLGETYMGKFANYHQGIDTLIVDSFPDFLDMHEYKTPNTNIVVCSERPETEPL